MLFKQKVHANQISSPHFLNIVLPKFMKNGFNDTKSLNQLPQLIFKYSLSTSEYLARCSTVQNLPGS